MNYKKRLIYSLIIIFYPLFLYATPHNIATLAKVSCSSYLDEEHSVNNIIDGIIRVQDKGEWIAKTKLDARSRVYPYPWLQLDWEEPVYVNKIILYDRVEEFNQTASGKLLFSDGSVIQVNQISDNGAPKVVSFDTKKIDWVRFQVTDAEGERIGLSEIEVYPAPESYSDYVSWVNPYIETAKGRYFFFVTGSLPFGMISSAPLTRNINQGGGGYNYNSDKIVGFPQIHNWMISGLSLMPVCGYVNVSKGDKAWYSEFSHDDEIVQPGYHRLYLDKYHIWVEQTITDRVSFYRFTYTKDAIANILVNLGGHISTSTMVNAHVTKITDQEISGYFDTTGRVWGGVDVAKVYFVIKLERPLVQLNAWVGDNKENAVSSFVGSPEIIEIPNSSFKQSPTSGVELAFGNIKAGESILLKTSVSYVSESNARENIEKECNHWIFNEVRDNAYSVWNEWLGKIEVKGGDDEQRSKFYTDLWHILLGRHKIDDYNGEYPDYLSGGKRIGTQTRIHTISPKFQVQTLPKDVKGQSKFHMYNSDALWLTQWNLNTLWGLAYPVLLDEFSASFLEYAYNGGLLPRGPAIGSYTYIMTGCPATSLITSAYQRGIYKKWDPQKGFDVMKNNHMKGGMLAFDMDKELDFYVKHGYCPNNAGLTIQWAFEDWALGQMAYAMGKSKDYRYFDKRSRGWKSSFNSSLKLVLPRKINGDWLHQNPLDENGYIQANAWQATFGLSHDISRLAQLMGGNDSLASKLNDAFEYSEPSNFLSSYVSYANQPGCSNAHVFSHVGKPWLTQYWVRKVRSLTYGGTTPEHGYGENDEDQGQMAGISALMSIGLFSLDGGSCFQPQYDITSPIFDEIIIHLDKNYYKGDIFRIKTHNNTIDNKYIQKALFNNKVYNYYQIPHSSFEKGGVLELWLGNKPNKEWGVSMKED